MVTIHSQYSHKYVSVFTPHATSCILNVFIAEDQNYKVVGKFYYKLHSKKTWWDANIMCKEEGAQLYYPEDQEEMESILPMWNKINLFIGFYYESSTKEILNGESNK